MREVRIQPLTAGGIDALVALAREIWMAHYPDIIGVAQIEYMLARRYDPATVREELRRDDLWWDTLLVDGELVGFASYYLLRDAAEMKLDKLYVRPDHQRHGHGGALIAHVAARARSLGCGALALAVNKRNAGAIAAYHRHGFAVRSAVVMDIGGGFVMDDFVMEMRL